MTKRDELRKLAEAADLNIDWIGAGPARHGDLISTSGKPLFIDSVYLDCDEQDVDGGDYFVCSAGSDEYGRFIAAASPRTVIRLLDDLKAAEQQRDELLLAMGVLRANIDDDYYKLYIDGVLTKVKPT